MSKTDDDKKTNADVLRAGDIIPPYNINNSQRQKKAEQENSSEIDGDKPEHEQILPEQTDDIELHKDRIPKFDLAKQIMFEQRKVSSVRRKKTDKKDKAAIPEQKNRSIDSNAEPSSILSQQEQIIAEIVQRDIQMLKKR